MNVCQSHSNMFCDVSFSIFGHKMFTSTQLAIQNTKHSESPSMIKVSALLGMSYVIILTGNKINWSSWGDMSMIRDICLWYHTALTSVCMLFLSHWLNLNSSASAPRYSSTNTKPEHHWTFWQNTMICTVGLEFFSTASSLTEAAIWNE